MIPNEKERRGERGVVVYIVAALAVALVAFVGLSLDVGRITLTDAELQASTDMAALSGALQIPDLTLARTQAQAVLLKNDPIAGKVIKSKEILFGNWGPSTRVFTPNGTPTNAIQVTGSRDSDHGTALPLMLLPVVGSTFADVNAVAVAYAAPRVGSPFTPALIGIEGVDVSGSLYVDGYDSSAGPYGGANANLPGTVWSGGPSTVRGSSHVTGDARAGHGYGQTSVEGLAVVDGSIEELTVPLDGYLSNFTTPSPPDAGTNDDAFITGDYILDDSLNFLVEPPQIADMPNGNYYFNNFNVKGRLTIAGPSIVVVAGNMTTDGTWGQITVTGPVEFYVAGTTYLAANSIINTTQDPLSLVLYGSGDVAVWYGTTEWYGYIYSLTAEVTIGGTADYYGGAVGRLLNLEGTAAIHTERGAGLEGPNYRFPVLVD